MNRTHYSALLALLVGCGSQDGTNQVEDDLAASKVRVLGIIQPGAKITTSYAAGADYLGYKFQADGGTTVDLTVSSSDGDPVTYLLDSKFKTLVRNNDSSPQTKNSRLTFKIPSAGTYYVAFKEATKRAATFKLGFAPTTGLIPTCFGAPTFPTRAPFNGKSVEKRTFARECRSGACSAWEPSEFDTLRPSTMDGQTQVDTGPRVSLAFGIDVYTQPAGGGQYYICDVTEQGLGSVPLDRNGQGEGFIQWRDACHQHSGSGGPVQTRAAKAFHVSYGSGCLSAIEHEPATPTGSTRQERVAYVVTF